MAKATRKTTTPTPDPILKLVADANARFRERDAAWSASAKAEDNLGLLGDESAKVFGVDYLGPFRASFTTAEQIDANFKGRRAAIKSLIDMQMAALGKKLSVRQRRAAQASLARARLELRHLKEVASFIKRELEREQRRLRKFRQVAEYEKAVTRRNKADQAALVTVRALSKAQPRTIEGAAALVKFIADFFNDNERIFDGLYLGDVLYRAHAVMTAAA